MSLVIGGTASIKFLNVAVMLLSSYCYCLSRWLKTENFKKILFVRNKTNFLGAVRSRLQLISNHLSPKLGIGGSALLPVALVLPLLLVASPANAGMFDSLFNFKSREAEQMDWKVKYEFGTPVSPDSDLAKTARVINITVPYKTYIFKPDKIKVKVGEVVGLQVKNEDIITHELVLGTKETIAHELEEIAEGEEHDAAHVPPFEIEVLAGQTKTLYWRFDDAGDFVYACLIAQHYDHKNKMEGYIKVVP